MQINALNNLYHSVYNLKYHLVLVPKYRRCCINTQILNRLESIFQNLIKKWDCSLLEFNGEADHVHLLISINPKVQPSVFVNNLKTVSSRLIRKEFSNYLKQFYSKQVFWSRTYCLLTCGGAPLSVIKQYIKQQAGIK